jgi:TrmH family RNA methyltransferase
MEKEHCGGGGVSKMESALRNVRIVLVGSEGPFNIGSVARVMKNMGLFELALVAPVEYKNNDGYCGAVGARDVLDNALVFPTLKEAVAGQALVVGTTRRAGRYRRIYCSVEQLPEKVFPVLAGGRVAIVFGREQSGLKSNETDLCHLLVTIPSSAGFPSLNLSHAVAVVCYKLFTFSMMSEVPFIVKPATSDEIEGLLDYLQSVFADLGFFSKGSHRYVTTLFRRIFGRAMLDHEEIENLTHVFHRLHGLCKSNREVR